jgi:hypothetical protein
LLAPEKSAEVVAIDDALNALATLDPRRVESLSFATLVG